MNAKSLAIIVLPIVLIAAVLGVTAWFFFFRKTATATKKEGYTKMFYRDGKWIKRNIKGSYTVSRAPGMSRAPGGMSRAPRRP